MDCSKPLEKGIVVLVMQQPPQSPYGPQYGPQQPVPQPLRKKSRKKPIIFGCLGLIALLFVIIVIAAIATGGGASQATTPGTTPTTPVQARATTVPTTAPTSVPTQAPTTAPKATSAPSGFPATSGRPQLGGPMSDFVGKLGQPNDHSTPGQTYHFLRVPGQALDGLIVNYWPGTQQAGDITVATPDPGWSSTDAETHCLAYAPLDSHFKQKVPFSDNTGYDMVYTSQSLSHLFPAADFTDANSNTVAAGTFDISYLYATDNQHIGSCDLIIGEQQTNG